MECLINHNTLLGSSETWKITNSTSKSPSCNMNYFFSASISDPACMQRKLYTEFDLLFDFISASVFGPGNMVFIFQIF